MCNKKWCFLVHHSQAEEEEAWEEGETADLSDEEEVDEGGLPKVGQKQQMCTIFFIPTYFFNYFI